MSVPGASGTRLHRCLRALQYCTPSTSYLFAAIAATKESKCTVSQAQRRSAHPESSSAQGSKAAGSTTAGCRSGYGSAKQLCTVACSATSAGTFASDSDSRRTSATGQDPSWQQVLPPAKMGAAI